MTALSEWMKENSQSASTLKELIDAQSPNGTYSIFTIQKWMSGKSEPRPKARKALMRITGLSLEQLMAKKDQ